MGEKRLITKRLSDGRELDYEILQFADRKAYRVAWRVKNVWRFSPSRRWTFLKTWGIYHASVKQMSSCHEAEVAIDEHWREQEARAQGWHSIGCVDGE